jgi:hypothetical protein
MVGNLLRRAAIRQAIRPRYWWSILRSIFSTVLQLNSSSHCRDALQLSQKLAEIDDPAKREELLQAMAHGSAAAWGHLNLLGEYDFSEDKLQDSVGIKPPKLTD